MKLPFPHGVSFESRTTEFVMRPSFYHNEPTKPVILCDSVGLNPPKLEDADAVIPDFLTRVKKLVNGKISLLIYCLPAIGKRYTPVDEATLNGFTPDDPCTLNV